MKKPTFKSGEELKGGNDLFCQICKATLDIEVVKEFKFHPSRKWRYDYAIVESKIAIEVEGGVWSGGRHTTGKGFTGDMEKYNAGTLLGWRIFRVTPENLLKTLTFEMIKEALK